MGRSRGAVPFRPRFYYGWIIVGACNLVAFITWGVGVFNQGVFLGYLVDTYGWSRAALSVGPMFFHLWAGVAGIVVGRLLDRRGPRGVLVVGALAMAAGVLGFGLVRHFWHTYLAFWLLSTGFACLHTVTLGKIVARWFVHQRARAMAAATFGASLGGSLLVPLNAALLQRWGGPAGGWVLAMITIGLVVPLALWVIKDGPEELGLPGDGDPQPLHAPAMATRASDAHPWTVAEAMRTSAFWTLAISFLLGMIAQSGFLVHQVMFLQATFDLLAAATVVTVTTLTGTLGRLSFTLFGNLWPPRQVTTGIFLLQAAAFGLLATTTAAWGLVLGSALFGFTMGIVVILQPLTTAQCFGQQAFGRIYGPIYLGIRLGSALGPLLCGLLSAAVGSYQPVWLLVAGGLLLAAFCSRWAVPPQLRAVVR
ncbi:MAG: MFS transporter [Candidatus Tectimicrobiota bacterium]|nr:MAG: MFS transporter [Candidatus Tectomicrobia bacterium]